MTTFLLIRHGDCEPVGKSIAGRMSGVNLNDRGLEQARILAERLGKMKIDRLYSSPLERTRQTAAPLAKALGLDVQISEKLHEINYGKWTGKTFEELSTVPLWKEFYSFKSNIRIPGGEMIVEVESRMCGFIEEERRRCNGTVAIFSHGDPIKTIIAHYMGFPLDFIVRLEISPASVSVLRIDDYSASVLTVNNTGIINI
jgi:probable phosphomutase (TIGR03848 family)